MKKFNGPYRGIKRTFDIVISVFALIVLSPLIIVITIINFFCAKGKPFFLDPRIGRCGEEIRVIKFTSMRHDAESKPEKYLNRKQMREWKKNRKVKNDPRVTGFGRFLRKTSIDEIPQLLNILAGTISLIGPRPITQMELDENFTEEERAKLLSVKPGLTGNWAVNGRDSTKYSNHRRQQLELDYCDNISFKTDVKIFWKTFITLIQFRNVG